MAENGINETLAKELISFLETMIVNRCELIIELGLANNFNKYITQLLKIISQANNLLSLRLEEVNEE